MMKDPITISAAIARLRVAFSGRNDSDRLQADYVLPLEDTATLQGLAIDPQAPASSTVQEALAILQDHFLEHRDFLGELAAKLRLMGYDAELPPLCGEDRCVGHACACGFQAMDHGAWLQHREQCDERHSVEPEIGPTT